MLWVGFDHMKQECPTYLKTIEKSKALANVERH